MWCGVFFLMDSDIESVADAFIERFQSITGSLSLPFSVSRNDIVSVLRLHSSVDDRVKGLLSLPQLRLIGGPQILTKLRQALVGGERVVQDFRGSAERMVATGGVAFFVIDSKPRVVQAWIVLCFLLFVYFFFVLTTFSGGCSVGIHQTVFETRTSCSKCVCRSPVSFIRRPRVSPLLELFHAQRIPLQAEPRRRYWAQGAAG